jgi:outer membrane protein insertion porin family
MLLTTVPAFAQRAPVVVVSQSPARPLQESQHTDENPAEAESGEKAVVKFEGLRSVSEKDIYKALHEERVNVYKPFVYDPAKIENAARIAREQLIREGYLHAAVSVREDRTVHPNVITLEVDEGKLARIEEIRFEGNKAVPGSQLADEVRGCLDKLSDRDEGSLYKPARVDYCIGRSVRGFLGREGYTQAEVGKYKVEETESGVRIIVPVTEGLRYRLGKVRVKGATVFLPEQIAELLELKPGDIADREKVITWLEERLRDEYVDRGYIQYSFDIEPAFRAPAKGKAEGRVDLKVEVFEGVAFTISSVTFKGNRVKTAAELQSALSLREGDVFSPRRLREGLERLAELGVYSGDLKADSSGYGVDIYTDDDKAKLSITVHVREGDSQRPPSDR